MARVICRLPNAGHNINGVRFASIDGGGMLSEDIPDETAAAFCSIRGYTLYVLPAVVRQDVHNPLPKKTSVSRNPAASLKETA